MTWVNLSLTRRVGSRLYPSKFCHVSSGRDGTLPTGNVLYIVGPGRRFLLFRSREWFFHRKRVRDTEYPLFFFFLIVFFHRKIFLSTGPSSWNLRSFLWITPNVGDPWCNEGLQTPDRGIIYSDWVNWGLLSTSCIDFLLKGPRKKGKSWGSSVQPIHLCIPQP